MNPKTSPKPVQVLFIEFATGKHYEGLKPFAFATSGGRRYDVDYDPNDESLVYHCCAYGVLHYLENARHQYWADKSITVITNSGEPAPLENRVQELPEEFRGRFDEWPDMIEGNI